MEGELVLDTHKFGHSLAGFLIGGSRVHSHVIVAHIGINYTFNQACGHII